MLHKLERGEVSGDKFVSHMASKCDMDENEVLEEFNSIILGDWMPGMKELIEELDRDILLLSNINEIHWKEIAPILDGYYKKAYLSHEMGCRKPEPKIYMEINNELILNGNEEDILFYDNRPENVKAAREFGWKPQLFRSAEMVKKHIDQHSEKLLNHKD